MSHPQFCLDSHPFRTLREYQAGTENERVWPADPDDPGSDPFRIAECVTCASSVSWPVDPPDCFDPYPDLPPESRRLLTDLVAQVAMRQVRGLA